MEEWAGLYENVRFLTVCVDALGVAKQFGMMFGLTKAVNCHIPSRGYFPVGYGQLGCSGFIISDENGCFISRKTKAYLQCGDKAFSDVEEILLKHFDQQPSLPDKEISGTISDFTNDLMNERVSSVGVEVIDFEHEQCENALSRLQTALDTKALEHVLSILKEHFAHEEELMKSFEFGKSSDGNGFSPFDSHTKDHQRILEIGYSELTRASSSSSKNCSSVTS